MLVPVTGIRHIGYALALSGSLTGASAGCTGRGPEAEPGPDPLAPTPLTVTNGTFLDYAVYVDHDNGVSRVATVNAASKVQFLIPPWMTQHSHSIRLFAHGIGSTGSINTDFIHVQPGQYIEWRLEPDLARSSVAVY